jgi:co-chaperonin GroES (HSP10)
MNFIPSKGHILIKPKEITEAVKKVKTEDGREVNLLMSDHSKDLKIKAVNEGTVITSASDFYKTGEHLVYYPFSPNKINLEEVEHHIIHERDVMGEIKD